ncbi:MAG TPA: ABC transporter substrate-binding protein, partial [Dehalococcoidia bacterium]|nr:ABC transporter substrate-binding protein [Dehalococcoidia bacterium]
MIGNFGIERFDGVYGSTVQDYMRIIHSFLISADVKDGQRVFIPGIATQWQMSSDGLTWIFTIRDGVKFFDGKELTAEDVVWSLRHHHGPDSFEYSQSDSAMTIARNVDRMEQTGPDQVSVTFKEPFVEYTERISENTGATHGAIHPKRASLHDDDEAAAYDENPIGAGIMRLVEHVPSDVMSFERFADHYQQPENGFPTDKRVNFTLLDLRLIPEESTRVAALRAGSADIAPISLATREQVEAGGGRLVFGPEAVFLMPNYRGCWKSEFPCHDKRVRQALDYAIDKELMRDRLYGPDVMQVK